MRCFLFKARFSCGATVCLAVIGWLLGATIASANTLTYPVKAADGTVVGHVTVTDGGGTGITGGFTSTYGGPPASQQAAAEKCGEDHFNWLQIVTSDNDPPVLPDGTRATPPYVDPPSGGFAEDWADRKRWYWDEGDDPDPRPENWQDGYHVDDNLVDDEGDGAEETLEFSDYPSGDPGTRVTYQTFLVSLNANGSLHSMHSGFAWSYTHTGGEGDAPADDAGRNIFGPTPGIKTLHIVLPSGMGYQWASLLGLIPGDANLDGMVDAQDATIIADHWGMVDPSLTMITWKEGDFNCDGMVNAADASILAANWGIAPALEVAAVPEPSVLLLLAGVFGTLALRRRR